MAPTNFYELIKIFIDLIWAILPVLGSLAFLVFIWGLAKFIFRVGGDEKAIEEGKKLMVWGLVGLFVMVSFISIISFAYNDIGFSHTFGFPFLPEN